MMSPEDRRQLRRSAASAGVHLMFADLGPGCSPGVLDARDDRPLAIIDQKLSAAQAATALAMALSRSSALREAS